MIKNQQIKLMLNNTEVAAATNVGISLNQSADQYIPIPNTEEDDGWTHYMPGALSWSIDHDGFLTNESQNLLSDINSDTEFTAKINLYDEHSITGIVRLSEVSVSAEVRGLSSITAKFVCDDFPTLDN